ncbi:hypothetical protein U9M48_011203 [Paspalum notatum var. saurae]|uniref:Glutaredoxin domain-containing protein n=1 Tax=Paspalum notatum var. saurae TaxID=547442 RepID=A0AAQ3WH42_PASNO
MAASATAAATPLSVATLAALPVSARRQPATVAYLPRGRGGPLPTQRLLALGRRPARLQARGRPVRCQASLSPEMRATLDKVVGSNKVVLFMKGTKDFPQCGFSHTVVQILRSLDVPFETLDVLANEALRQGLKDYSSWPTFPQLYIDGEFFGGCDITVALLNKVKKLLECSIEKTRLHRIMRCQHQIPTDLPKNLQRNSDSQIIKGWVHGCLGTGRKEEYRHGQGHSGHKVQT